MSKILDNLMIGGDLDDFTDYPIDCPDCEDELNEECDDCRKENDAIHCWDYPGDGYAYDAGYDSADDELPL